MNSKTPLTVIVGGLKAKIKQRPVPKISIDDAANEIADALNIKHEAAMMMLYGLCATGNVRWFDNAGEVIDEDQCTIAGFSGKPKSVIADDVRHWLAECSSVPQSSRRETVIAAMIAEGHIPPRTVDWKTFCNRVREKCNARLDAKGRPPFGFGDKQIQRIVNDLRSK